MIKANQTYFNAIQIILDMIVVSLALLLAYWLRFVSPFFHDGPRIMNFLNYFHLLVFIIPVYFICYFILGLYKPFRKVRFLREAIYIIAANTIGIMITVTYLYFTKDINYSRLMLGFFYIGSNVFLIIERFTVRKVLREFRRRGYNLKHVIVVGAGKVGETFVKKIQSEPQLGYNIVGYIDDYYSKEKKDNIKILGKTNDLENILATNFIDEVVIALPNNSYEKINKVIDVCELQGVKTQVIPDYIKLLHSSQSYIDELDGIPLINTRYIPLDDPFKAGFKRLGDIIISTIGLIITSPILLLTALGVKLTSPGPIIYKQNRVGKNRKEFTIYKFRSMRVDQPDDGKTGWTVEDDPRKTKFGSFIRKYSIDELPQLVNVLKGDMSLIGPRPELPYWVDKYKKSIPNYMIKHHVRPGITGLAQVRGYRGDTSIKERIDIDLEYIENWSPLLDLEIMLKTPKAMLEGS